MPRPLSVEIKIGKRRFTLPRSRAVRLLIGSALVLGGLLGFLPVLGFWMIPLGLIVLSADLPLVRRWRRRLVLWWEGRKRERRDGADSRNG